jgi:hypothetical protein
LARSGGGVHQPAASPSAPARRGSWSPQWPRRATARLGARDGQRHLARFVPDLPEIGDVSDSILMPPMSSRYTDVQYKKAASSLSLPEGGAEGARPSALLHAAGDHGPAKGESTLRVSGRTSSASKDRAGGRGMRSCRSPRSASRPGPFPSTLLRMGARHRLGDQRDTPDRRVSPGIY